MTILLFVMLGVFVFMMFRRNKKTQQQQTELQSKFGPGVEVMTSFGLFGRIVEIDEAENKVVLELSPGNTAVVHRQAVSKIVEPVAAAGEPTIVPDDASSLSLGTTGTVDTPGATGNGTVGNGAVGTGTTGTTGTGATAAGDAPRVETPDETLRRLNDEGRKDS
ncbi:preprotein translocase subunit YajC [Arthrobacter sp. B3I4]|uniref:preprotein translocase subunit YajC n=1 Tax=Arthrobacter sp. B3I4 TaxID=3042267 RepID=UPI00277FB22E|nr:preprotein translocase subunit YajC [Arthrobacter sp. B3I4]MDQ0756301.1 preprotein translocase subunit YajC [Arthrobacter sp. B3I4]